MPRFNSINFYQNRTKIELILQQKKNTKFSNAGGKAPRLRASGN